MTSPNYPYYYPRKVEKTEMIQVEIGKIVRLEFTSFRVSVSGSVNDCKGDHVLITDGDGTILMNKSCGYSTYSTTHSYYFLPPVIHTNTNSVRVFFGASISRDLGWSLSWGAVMPGL